MGLLATWVYRRRRGSSLRLPWFGAVLLGVVAFIVLQAVPLPMGLLRVIAPATAELLTTTLAPKLPAWHPISLDPSATIWEAMKLLTCTFAFLIAYNGGHRRTRRRRIHVAIAAAAAFIALVAMVGSIVAPGKPLLFYTPRSGIPLQGLIAPAFINVNHAAAFLLLGSILGFGLTFTARGRARGWLAGAASLSGVGVILTLSRGGILAYGFGLVAMWGLLLWRGRVRWRSLASLVMLVGAVAAVGSFAGRERLASELHIQKDAYQREKTALWKPGWKMVRANAWVGVGRGAFMPAFPRYLSTSVPLDRTYSHLENQYLHLPAELGLPVGGGLIFLSLWALFTWLWRGGASATTIAAFAAIAALGLHNIFDFNLEMLGIALPVAALAGAMAGRASPPPRRLPRRRGVAVASACAVALALLLMGWTAAGLAPTIDTDSRRLEALVKARAAKAKLIAALEEYRRRHPADYMPHLVGAEILAYSKDKRAFRWLNRALVINPYSPYVHLRAARLLARSTAPGQARLEYRLALASGAPVGKTLSEALAGCKNAKEAQQVLPNKRPELWVMAIDRLLLGKRDAVAAGVAAAAVERWPRNERVVLAHARALHDRDRRGAVRIARDAVRRWHSKRSYRVLAFLLRDLPGSNVAAVLTEALKRYPDDAAFALHLARVELNKKNFARAEKLANRVARMASRRQERGRAHLLLSHIFRGQRRLHRARWELDRARELLEDPKKRRRARPHPRTKPKGGL